MAALACVPEAQLDTPELIQQCRRVLCKVRVQNDLDFGVLGAVIVQRSSRHNIDFGDLIGGDAGIEELRPHKASSSKYNSLHLQRMKRERNVLVRIDVLFPWC